jgi:small-conductance mechanosensitive channel
MIIPVLKILVYCIALFLIFSPLWELGIGEIAVLSGLFGAGLGLGLKDLFADIVAGFIIIVEKPYQIGDKIQIGDYYGEVTDIGLVQTILVTPGDSRVAVPNYSVLSNAVSSANAGTAEMMVITDLYISYHSDIDTAISIFTDAVTTSRYVYVSDTRAYTILVENHPFYRKLIAKAYVNDLRYEFVFKSDITKRAWDAFEKAGIKPPEIYPNIEKSLPVHE